MRNTGFPALVGLGEALIDVFPDGTESVGGAPLNFALHADRLARVIGKSAVIASRTGNDARGSVVRDRLSSAGIPDTFVQRDMNRPTGAVNVNFDTDGQPTYQIEPGAAWDFIESAPKLSALAEHCELVCYGSLAQRSKESRDTIEAFLNKAKKAVQLFDVNLRQPFVEYATLRRACASATALKLNTAELSVLASVLTLQGSAPGDRVLSLFARFPIEVVILTRGVAGTVIYTENSRFEGEPVSYAPEPGADSVGAGDAVSAAVAVGMVAGHPFEKIVEIANHVGAFVASRRGATPALPEAILREMAISSQNPRTGP